MAYDSLRGVTVLSGGVGASGYCVDTWEWNGINWLKRTAPSMPPERMAAAMAYDRARGVTVLFGGLCPAGRLADTWEWDGATWSQYQHAASPPGCYTHTMAYDTIRETMVMFGGSDGSNFLGNTWEFAPGLRLLQQPVNTVVVEGSDAVFGVTAIGSTSIRYQWRKNGAPLPGAGQASLRIPQATRVDAGTYDVVVRAPCGQILSEEATLTVALKADFDMDDDVDMADFGILQRCLSGENIPADPSCAD